MIVGDTLGRVTLWDGGTHGRPGVLPGTYIGSPSGDTNAVSALAFSADGANLAVAGKSGTVHLWDVASACLLGSALPASGDSVLSRASALTAHALRCGHASPAPEVRHRSEHLVAQICGRVESGLSRADRKTHPPGIPYRETSEFAFLSALAAHVRNRLSL
ncbi:hypothetical protein ACQEV2_00700 [Streptomyces sp. CA-251387]|uniref:hypothetical protein n=1 Tax=Streptomyces sp. CA-251387 TaxID=3240064 RepID=UPI003D8E059A